MKTTFVYLENSIAAYQRSNIKPGVETVHTRVAVVTGAATNIVYHPPTLGME